MQRAFVIVDPQHEYAREIIGVARAEHGLRPICVYMDSRAELYKREHFPELRRKGGALAHYYLDQQTPQQIAADIRAKFDVVGITPYFEQSLMPSCALMEALDLKWNAPDVIRRFRDKSGLKDYLRQHHPEIPLGESRRVDSVDDVFAAPLPERYVIKPNDGFANRDVGFFSRSDTKATVAAYFPSGGKAAFILEALLVGTEYAINGQMDADGKATVVNVIEYERVPANGKPNVYHRTLHVPRTDPAYKPLADYAAQVMNASGLRRAPFHLELMHTAEGPRLIEVGARFGGTRYVFMTNAVHDNKLNHFSLATHHYLSTAPYKGGAPNWAFYDKVSYVHLDGIAPRTERIYRLDGIDAVEAMPEFDGWVVKPEVGGLMRKTIDLYSVPYSCHLKSMDGRAEVVAASERVKATLKINHRLGAPRRLWVDAMANVTKLKMRARWGLRRLLARGA